VAWRPAKEKKNSCVFLRLVKERGLAPSEGEEEFLRIPSLTGSPRDVPSEEKEEFLRIPSLGDRACSGVRRRERRILAFFFAW